MNTRELLKQLSKKPKHEIRYGLLVLMMQGKIDFLSVQQAYVQYLELLKELIPYTEEQEQVDGRQDVVDMTLNTWLNSTPDWLAYRMELAKVVVEVVMRFEGVSNSERVAYHTMTIVDGIVERLKGGK